MRIQPGTAFISAGMRYSGMAIPDFPTEEEGSMNRDEYVEKMKRQLDDWNLKLADWEAEVQKAQGTMKIQFEAQIKAMEQQRDEALKRLNETRDASQAAWMDVNKGFEQAWHALHESFNKAWTEFHKRK